MQILKFKKRTIVYCLSYVIISFGSISGTYENSTSNNFSPSVYYVSNKGDDNSSGKTPLNAWKTLKRVEHQKLCPGDSVLLECNGIWRESLEIPQSGEIDAYITFSTFGSGRKPKILGSIHRTQNLYIRGMF